MAPTTRLRWPGETAATDDTALTDSGCRRLGLGTTHTMQTDALLMAIHRELQRRFRAAGPGTIGRIEASLGLSQGYFRDQRRKDRLRIDLRVLLRTLELLGVDRAEFFSAVLGSSDPMMRFRNEGLLLRVRRQRGVPILEAVERRQGATKPMTACLDLAALDSDRFDRPKEVERKIRLRIPKVEETQIIPLLGIYGSTCRSLGKVSRAHSVLAKALELAESGPPQVVAELLLRSASVLGDQGRFRYAAELAEKAVTRFALAGDRLGIAKALLKLGMAQGCAGLQEEEIRSFEAARSYLENLANEMPARAGAAPEDEPEAANPKIHADTAMGLELQRNLFSVLTNLALAHHQQQEFQMADSLAHRAEKVAEGLGPILTGKLIWLRGTLAWQQHLLPQAETHLRRALELHRSRAPLSSALIAVDLVRVQLQQGHVSEATATARAMTTLVSSLERHPVALAAIAQLIRSTLEGSELSHAVKAAAEGLKRCGEVNPAFLKGWSRRNSP